MKSQESKRRKRAVVLISSIVIGILAACQQQPGEIPPEVAAAYRNDAMQFCTAMVSCMQDEVRERMADEPERRDMVIRRMNRDYCVDEQINYIGLSMADPDRSSLPDFQLEHYQRYAACSQAIVAAVDCSARRAVYETQADCVFIRELQP